MKSKVSILIPLGLLACCMTGLAQNSAPAADPAAAAPPAATNNNTTAAAPDTNTPAAAPDTNTPAPVPAAEAASNAQAASDILLGATPGTVIPLIVMDEVPLTDAIRNLARQAALNYMLDPKLTFGQPGPDGRVMAQPMVSIRWEDVTAQQALLALLNNYNLQINRDPKTRIARVTMRDPAAPDPLVTQVIQLKYASPTNLLPSVISALDTKRSKAIADIRSSQLVVVATEKELTAINDLVERLDTPTKQVLIEARLIETSMNPTSKKGVDWTGTLQNQNVRFGNNLLKDSATQNATLPPGNVLPKILFDTAKGFNPATAFLDADGVSAVISFLNTYADAKVLSTPRTVTLDNEQASLEVTRANPIINVTAGTANTTGGSQITYTNLGVKLHVTPRISANNYVNLRVIPEVSRVFDTINRDVGDARYTVDRYDVRKMETHVMIPSGNTLVMGGMMNDAISTGNQKVPVLGDIPILGYAFRSDSKSREKANLLIFLTPTIITDGDFQPTKTDFLKSPVPANDTLGPDWGAWDSGKPKDWSKGKAKSNEEAFSDPAAYMK